MKLSDYKNEEALDLLVDVMDPVMEILGDHSIRDMARSGNRKDAIKAAIKNHKKSVMQVLARVDGVPYEEYECSAITLPAKILEILNDKEMIDFFASQSGEMQT